MSGSLKERYLDFLIRRIHHNIGRNKMTYLWLDVPYMAIAQVNFMQVTYLRQNYLLNKRKLVTEFPTADEVCRRAALFGFWASKELKFLGSGGEFSDFNYRRIQVAKGNMWGMAAAVMEIRTPT